HGGGGVGDIESMDYGVLGGQPGRNADVGDGQRRGVPGRAEFLVLLAQIHRQEGVVLVQSRHAEMLLVLQRIPSSSQQVVLLDVEVVVRRSAFALEQSEGAEIHAGAGG